MLTRRTALRPTQKPLRSKPRSKGNRGEREIIDLLAEHGWTTARRNILSGGLGGSDIVEGIPGVAIEVKRCETCSIWSWIAQCEAAAKPTDIPLVAFRRNRSRWYGCVPTHELDALLKFTGRRFYTRRRPPSERARIWVWLDDFPGMSPDRVPVLQFRRAASDWYSIAPLLAVLEMLREREVQA